MEQGTQVAGRLLEAVAPALGAELELVLAEAREAQEAEFQTRLESAVRDAREEVRRAADAEAEQAVSAASAAAAASASAEASRETTTQLETQFSEKLKEALEQNTTELQRQSSGTLRELEQQRADERTQMTKEISAWRFLAEAESRLASSDSQPEMLIRFLRLASETAPSVALYVVKNDGLALWKSRGAAVFPPIVSAETSDPDMYFRSLVVLGKPVAAITAAAPFRRDALDFLSACLERSIALLGLKLQRPAPTVPGNGGVVSAAAEVPDALHAEARQTARQLVAEIKLSSDEEVREGRANRDLYRRLRNPIDNARQQYQTRVSSAVREARDYFHEELVHVLAENDPAGLGADYPGAEV